MWILSVKFGNSELKIVLFLLRVKRGKCVLVVEFLKKVGKLL